MIGFLTDENNDLTLDKFGDIAMVDGIDAYRQNLVNEIRLQQFEYGYDLSKGLNYMGYLFGDKGDIVAWESQLFEMLSKKSFIKRIVEWERQVDGNNFLFKLVVETDLGNIEIKG